MFVHGRMRNDPLIGRKVADRFTIERYLGEGGMATVYVAEQAAEPRRVALKIMNQELTADRSFMHRFQREAEASARVQHPNSVQIIDYGVTDDGISYIAMELLDGDDLYVLLERQGAISQSRAARILAEILDALTVAHDLGIVHRDLKPENVMIVADPSHPNGERVKVLDFGIAKLLALDEIAKEQGGDAEPSSAVTRAGTFIGTPAYMSPEQCNLLPVDTRADIYTCGVLLFQLVTGRLPFEGETPLQTAMLHIHKEPPAPSSLAPAIDPQLEQVILKALAKKPSDRYPTARDFSAALRKILPGLRDVPVSRGPLSKRPVASWGPPPPSSGVRGPAPRPPTPLPPETRQPTSDDLADSTRTLIRESMPEHVLQSSLSELSSRFGPRPAEAPPPPKPAPREVLPALKSTAAGATFAESAFTEKKPAPAAPVELGEAARNEAVDPPPPLPPPARVAPLPAAPLPRSTPRPAPPGPDSVVRKGGPSTLVIGFFAAALLFVLVLVGYYFVTLGSGAGK